MLWPIEEPAIDTAHFGTLKPERVLFEFEGPRTFIARDAARALLLLHQCGESEHVWRYFVVPFSESLLAQLEEGRIDLRTALDQPRLWVADLNPSGVLNLFQIQDRTAVEPYLPVPGTMLFPEIEPFDNS